MQNASDWRHFAHSRVTGLKSTFRVNGLHFQYRCGWKNVKKLLPLLSSPAAKCHPYSNFGLALNCPNPDPQQIFPPDLRRRIAPV